MNKLISILVMSIMLLTNTFAWADEAIMTPLNEGMQAPYAGVLLSPAAVAQIAVELQSASERTKIEVDNARKLEVEGCRFQIEKINIENTTNQKILTAKVDATKKENEILNDRIKKIEDQPSAWFYVGAGALGGIVTTVLISIAISSAQK